MVRLGQIWKDNDRRAEGKRTLLVTRIFPDDTVECEVFISGTNTGRKAKVRADRFNNKSKGYTLVTKDQDKAEPTPSRMTPTPPPNVPIMYGG